jgi:hypothetical protein
VKKIYLFLICCAVIFSCKKSDNLPDGTLQTEGILHNENYPDGFGLFYQIDFTNEMIIFKDTFASDSAQLQYYQQYINVHTRLYYLDHGDTGCLYGIGRTCPFRVVEPVRLEKE